MGQRKYYVLLIIIALLLSSFLLPLQTEHEITIVNAPSFTDNKSYLFVSGVSPHDPYDRVISIFDNTAEIARIITPLHRDGSLPNHFSFLLNFTFAIQSTDLYYSVLRVQSSWTVYLNVLHTAKSSQKVSNVISPTVQNITSELNEMFYVPRNGTLYLLVSLHSSLESRNGYVVVDGQRYLIYNWHPLDELQLTTIGVVIPPIKISITKGIHTLSFDVPIGPYVYYSAYEVNQQ